jgi:hypothetical protein
MFSTPGFSEEDETIPAAEGCDDERVSIASASPFDIEE